MPDPRPLRLFARLRRAGFDLECPGCGKVYIVRPATRGSQSAQDHNQKQAKLFDEGTGIFQCTNYRCLRAYQIGLNLRPLGRGVIVPRRRRVPVDTVPTLDQADALRKLEHDRGVELRDGIPSQLRRGRVNRVRGAAGPVNTGPACTCPENWRGEPSTKFRDAQCPRHGDGGESPEEE